MIHQMPIDNFIADAINRDPLMGLIVKYQVEMQFVHAVFKRHYSDMGLYYVTKAQAEQIRHDMVRVFKSSSDIKAESDRQIKGSQVERYRSA